MDSSHQSLVFMLMILCPEDVCKVTRVFFMFIGTLLFTSNVIYFRYDVASLARQ